MRLKQTNPVALPLRWSAIVSEARRISEVSRTVGAEAAQAPPSRGGQCPADVLLGGLVARTRLPECFAASLPAAGQVAGSSAGDEQPQR